MTFKPNQFFNELEKQDSYHHKAKALKNAFYRAIKSGLIEMDDQNIPRLTVKGRRQLAPYQSKKLRDSSLMVVFDIPETKRWKRQHLRQTLKEFNFKKVQQSVWITHVDCEDYVRSDVENLGLEPFVQLYEVVRK